MMPEHTWINNPLLNTEKAVELIKLRRDVRLKLILSGNQLEIRKPRTVSGLTCSQPILGRWINDCDVPFLMKTLALTDVVFNHEFPGIQLSREERKVLARTLEEHSRECVPCGAGALQTRTHLLHVFPTGEQLSHFIQYLLHLRFFQDPNSSMDQRRVGSE